MSKQCTCVQNYVKTVWKFFLKKGSSGRSFKGWLTSQYDVYKYTKIIRETKIMIYTFFVTNIGRTSSLKVSYLFCDVEYSKFLTSFLRFFFKNRTIDKKKHSSIVENR